MRKTTRLLLAISALVFVIASATGCATDEPEVVLIPMEVENDGTPADLLRFAEDVEAHVYIWNDAAGAWIRSRNKVTIPHGWLTVPPETGKQDQGENR